MRIFLVAFFLWSVSLSAQHTISGTFSPADDYTWLIAYRLTPGGETYVSDTSIEKGRFTLKIPQSAVSGSYRLVYAVPKEEFYFDIIYNGKEDIQLEFSAEDGVKFIKSEENRHFNAYFNEINRLERRLVGFYAEGKNDATAFGNTLEKLRHTQKTFEEKTEGLLCLSFVRANHPYIPEQFITVNEYVKAKKENYFKKLDLKNPLLQASGFLTDKLTNYVFTALPLKKMTPAETESAMIDNTVEVNDRMTTVDDTYKFHVFHTLWKQAANNSFSNLADFIFNSYLKKLSEVTDNQSVIEEIEAADRLRIGAMAPEINWKEGNSDKKLSVISGAEHYVLVFWSSTCSHCLSELPVLHKKLGSEANVKVVAIGLEDDHSPWKKEAAKLENFEHAIALGKWESEYAQLYDIHQTPTYFILNSDKKIVAKPKSDKEVVAFLESND